VNPALYAAYNQKIGVFNDITIGSNGVYSAGVGYDLPSGLGSLKGHALAAYLSTYKP
jgi:hypothetical protein